MDQPLTLDEIHVDPARAAQVIYDLRREYNLLRDEMIRWHDRAEAAENVIATVHGRVTWNGPAYQRWLALVDPAETCTCDFDSSFSGGLCDVCGRPEA